MTKKYTSPNPLGVSSKFNNAVYYAEEYNSGDHLCNYDLDTKKSQKLSDGLIAMNQIILLGCKDGHQGLYTYDTEEVLYESKNELINSFELLE